MEEIKKKLRIKIRMSAADLFAYEQSKRKNANSKNSKLQAFLCLLFFPKIKERVHLNVAGLISASREEKRHFPIERQVACLQDKSYAFVYYSYVSHQRMETS